MTGTTRWGQGFLAAFVPRCTGPFRLVYPSKRFRFVAQEVSRPELIAVTDLVRFRSGFHSTRCGLHFNHH